MVIYCIKTCFNIFTVFEIATWMLVNLRHIWIRFGDKSFVDLIFPFRVNRVHSRNMLVKVWKQSVATLVGPSPIVSKSNSATGI